MTNSTTVIGAHINGWIFAQQTPTPAVPTTSDSAPVIPTASDSTPIVPTTSEPAPPVCSSGGKTNSAIVFGIGVALAVVGIFALAAGVFIMRRSRKALQGGVQPAAHVPNSGLALSQEPSSQYRPTHQPNPGALFLPVPARMRHSTPQLRDKEPQELDASPPTI